MAILLKDLCPEVMRVIYEKQKELQIKKLRCVSLKQTVETLIKDAYLTKEKATNVTKAM